MKKLLCILILIALAGVLFHAVDTLPSAAERKEFGVASKHIRSHAIRDSGAINLVAAVLFDYRGFDTLGEVTVIFSAVAGVGLLFPGKAATKKAEGLSPIAKGSVATLVPFIFLVGFYIVLHGHLSPGGGFQGGVVWGSLLILLGIVYGTSYAEGVVTQNAKTITECLGALAFIGLGCLGLFTGGWFLANLEAGYPHGIPGALVSAGVIPLLSFVVGIKIGAGLSAIFYSMVNDGAEDGDGT